MQLENVITKILRFIDARVEALAISVTSGGVDNMEKYRYIIGQINGLEATRQELSNLLDDKEQNEKESVMVKKIKKVAKALKKASALHKKQSKVIEKHIKEMKRGGSKKRYG